MKRVFPLLIAAALPVLPPTLSGQGQHSDSGNRVVLEQIVARVNNSIITLTDLEASRQALRRELMERYQGTELEQQYEQAEKTALRDLIDQQLLVQTGEELGLSVEAEVVKHLDRLRQQLNLPSMEALERAVAAQGMSFEDYRQQVRNQILTQMVVQREVAGKVFLDDEQVRDYYLQHRNEFNRPEQVRLREILIATQGLSGEELAAKEAKLQEALEKIRKGEAFEEVAKAYSESPTAPDGGNLGAFEPEKLSSAIREVIGKLREGGVSDPLRTQQGWLVLQLVSHSPAGIQPFEEVADEIRQKLYYDQVQPALREYLSQLRRENYVYVAPGFVDAGAVEKEFLPANRRPGSKRAKQKS
ncbi:MAG TPA: peptidyl-prolyl cis-trans isomerase [Candidatus Xenobia bacterium]|nr:peptidyl-prolyl cis-trans isomerase [Candidatus Xenobia bacterium]